MERSQTTSPDSTKHLSGKATSSQPTSKQFKPARSSLASTILHSRQCSRLESEPTLTSPSSRTCPSNPRQRRGAGRLSRSRRRQKCPRTSSTWARSEEHTSELQSQSNLVCRLLLEKK